MNTDADMRGLKDPLIEGIRAGSSFEQPDIGITSAVKSAGEEDGITVVPMSPTVGIRGFSVRLARIALSNADKLKEARPRQTHLAVVVDLLMGSRDISLTAPPPHPIQLNQMESIDWVWVLFGFGPSITDDRPWAWWAQPGQTDWMVESGPV